MDFKKEMTKSNEEVGILRLEKQDLLDVLRKLQDLPDNSRLCQSIINSTIEYYKGGLKWKSYQKQWTDLSIT